MSFKFRFFVTFIVLETLFMLGIVVLNFNSLDRESKKLIEEKTQVASTTFSEIERLYRSMHLMQQNIKKREDELVLERERALAASKAKSEFLAVMSHEIRTPINGMTGALNLIERDKLDKQTIDQVDTALTSSELLLTVINDLLDYSRIEPGKFTINAEPFSVGLLLKEIDTIYRPLIESAEVDFSVHGAESVADMYCRGDRTRIKQILSNYLNNAIKFTRQGSIKLIAERLESREVKFVVEDTGIGVKPGDLDKLFKGFSQINSGVSREFGGAGLALEEIEKSVYAAANFVPQAQVIGSAEVNAKILLVEDNLNNQKVVSRMLEKADCDVKIAGNGIEALDMIDGGDFDVVLMDCQMPVMDGFTATRELRQRGNGIPIVALTANAHGSDREACLKAGMDAFITKPFQSKELFSIIQSQMLPVPA